MGRKRDKRGLGVPKGGHTLQSPKRFLGHLAQKTIATRLGSEAGGGTLSPEVPVEKGTKDVWESTGAPSTG